MPWVALLLAAAPLTPKLAAGGFTAVGVEPAKAQFFSDYFADQVNATERVRVVTQSEMAAMLGAERQRQLLGCSDSSCLAELAGALDVGGVILGSAAQVGDELAIQVKVVASDGRILGLYSTRVTKEPQVLDFLSASARDLVDRLAPAPKAGRSRAWVVPAVVGGALLVASVVCYVLAGATYGRIAGGERFEPFSQLAEARASGERAQLLGHVFLGVGLLGFATAAFFGFTGVLD